MKTCTMITATTGLLILSLLFFANCRRETIAGQWAGTAITIDGDQSDWQAPLIYNEKLDASFAVQNDSTNIYFLLISSNSALTRQFLMSGLVLWLDQDGGRAHNVGFKFPIGLMERQARAMDLFMALNPKEGAVDEARVNFLLKLHFSDLQVLGAKNKNLGILSPATARKESILYALKYHNGQFVYELALPLMHSDRGEWAIKSTSQFAFGLETPEFDVDKLGGRRPMAMGTPDATTGSAGGMRGGGMRGGRGGGGMRGGGGGMSGNAGPGMMGGRFGTQEPIKFWATVIPATTQP